MNEQIKRALERGRTILTRILHNIGRSQDLEAWVAGSPLVEVEFTEG
jgi:hypothetical protein